MDKSIIKECQDLYLKASENWLKQFSESVKIAASSGKEYVEFKSEDIPKYYTEKCYSKIKEMGFTVKQNVEFFGEPSSIKSIRMELILPYRTPIRKPKDYRRAYRMYERHPVNGINIYDRIERLLYCNRNKSFSECFKYFCKQVPYYQQKIIFSSICYHTDVKCRYYDYYIDKNNIIRHNPSVFKKKYRVPVDKKVVWRALYSDKVVLQEPHQDVLFLYNKQEQYIYKVFDSKKDPEYKRYVLEYNKNRKSQDKLKKQLDKNRSINIFEYALKKRKEEIRKEKELEILRKNAARFEILNLLLINHIT